MNKDNLDCLVQARITKDLKNVLEKEREKTGAHFSEIVRRALVFYFRHKNRRRFK